MAVFNNDLGKQIEGIFRLAMVGAFFLVFVVPAGVLVGVVLAAVWAWNHLSVAVH